MADPMADTLRDRFAIETIEAFECSDGTIFKDPLEAAKYNLKLQLEEVLETENRLLGDTAGSYVPSAYFFQWLEENEQLVLDYLTVGKRVE